MKKIITVFLFIIVSYFIYTGADKPDSIPIQRVQIKGNEACTYIQNTGIFNFNSASYVAGLFWPCDIFSSYCYSSGLCASGIINGKLGQFVCSFRGELVPGYIANNSLQKNPDFKIYFVKSTDNESTNPDYANWYKMVPYGAPYQDLNNNCIFDAGIDKPGFPGAVQTAFVCLTDADTAQHYWGEGFGGGITNPLLMAEIRLTVWTYSEYPFNTTQMFRYQIINKGINKWDSLYFALFSDPDIISGIYSTPGEFIGCDTLRHLGFAYSDDTGNVAYGLRILRGPVIKSTNDSIFMSSATWISKYYPCENDVYGEPEEAHWYMKGFKRGGTSFLDPTRPLENGRFLKTKFVFPGDPESNIGWTVSKGRINNCDGSDTGTIIPNEGGDRRMIIGMGADNFSIIPGDTQLIVFSQTLASGSSNLNSITKLKDVSDRINYLYQKEIKNYAENFCPHSSASIPADYSLSQNYPNPFNSVTKIKFSIPRISDVRLEVFDVIGKQVELLVNSEYNPGYYEIAFDAQNFASGIYFYRMMIIDKTASSEKIYSRIYKMALIK